MTQSEEDVALHRAHEALELGDAEQATYLARSVLEAAQDRQDRLYEGRALACLAHCDRQLSRLRRAYDSSRRAAHLLRMELDLASEVMALTTHAHTATSLGRVDEAVEGALLAVSLSEGLPPSQIQPLAHNYLGTAYFWCKDFTRAEAAFERSAALARAIEPVASPLQPLLNLAFLEAFRYAVLRFEGLRAPPVDRLDARLKTCAVVIEAYGDESLMPGMTVTARTLWHVLNGLADAWAGRLEAAAAELVWSEAWEVRYGQVTWLTGMRRWLQAEVALAQGDPFAALAMGREMITAASQAEHEELARLGHLIVASLLRAQGNRGEEAEELLQLVKRGEANRVEALASRAQAVEWQLEARASADRIGHLETQSRLLERLSLEDSLTGIPNRRALDRKLAAHGATSVPDRHETCLALIDVDRFKQVNDTYSHQVGDAVLKVVADVISSAVRAGDFVARLAGDEFVVLFERATLEDAQRICARMKAAVQGHLWHAIAPGLQVSISVGLEQAQRGESVQSLLQRSDERMYIDKRRASV